MANKIYTHSEAANIVEIFEECLFKYNISVPSPEDDERLYEDSIGLGLYGSTYSDVLDEVEAYLINIIERCNQEDIEIITDIFGD